MIKIGIIGGSGLDNPDILKKIPDFLKLQHLMEHRLQGSLAEL